MIAGLKLIKTRAILAAFVLCLNGTGLYAQAHRLLLSTSTLEFSSDKDVEIPTQTVLVYATAVTPLSFKATVDYMSPESGTNAKLNICWNMKSNITWWTTRR